MGGSIGENEGEGKGVFGEGSPCQYVLAERSVNYTDLNLGDICII